LDVGTTTIWLGDTRYGPVAPETFQFGKYEAFTSTGLPVRSTWNEMDRSVVTTLETLACGTGACAAVVAGIRWGLLDARVDVHTRGGVVTIAWAGGSAPVLMTGPAVAVFRGEIDLPSTL
jgi:hypothetical protein